MAQPPHTIELEGRDGRPIRVPVRISQRSRRLALRVDPTIGGPELVLPAGVSRAEAERFARRHIGWLEQNLSRLPDRVHFADGTRVPLLGTDHVIRHHPAAKRGAWAYDDAENGPAIGVSGHTEHLARRVEDFLKARARDEIAPRARGFAARLGAQAGRVTLRDTRSRWGSCSTRGDLSFCWRLIMAPERVLDYVCAHEAAHLLEMNHSSRFWRLVDGLVDDMAVPRAWLKRHGAALHRYG